jgi:putative ABC transport system permease protein
MSASGGRSRLVAWALRVYTLGLRLLPETFRSAYGEELRACFARMVTDARARGRLAVVGVTARSLVDVLRRSPVQHRAARHSERADRAAGFVGEGLGLDARQAVRRLLRRPSFTLTTVATLGLGIAATTSVFSLVHGVVLRPLPYPASDRLVEVDHAGPGVGAEGGLGIAHGFYRHYAAHARTVEAIAMYAFVEQTLVGRGEPVRLPGFAATPSLEAVLRVPAARGRWFTAADAEPGAARTVVLSHGLWQGRFGGDPEVVGTTVELGGVVREVVGVMPASFAFPSAEAAYWLPNDVPTHGVGGWNERAVARLAAGATPETVRRELIAQFPRMRAETDAPAQLNSYLDDARVTPLVVPLKESVVGDVRATLWILLGTVGLVLAIAVANVANLFLVRAEEAQREMAVRAALGAGRGRIARAFLMETLFVSAAAAAVGATAAGAAIGVLRARAPVNVPRLNEVGVDATVLLVVVLMALASALVLGLLPSWRGQAAPGAALADGGQRTTAGRTRRRGRDGLMATQVALALVLLIGSGLLLRTFTTLRAAELGFTTRQALTFEIGLPSSRYETSTQAKLFQDRLLQRLGALPGVSAAGAVGRCLPLVGSMCGGEVLRFEGRAEVEGQVPPVTGARVATASYFEAIGIPVVRGRGFTAADESGDAAVALLSEAAAAAYFPGEDPVGRRFRFASDGAWHTVVGVAGSVRGEVETADADALQRLVYMPLRAEAEDGPGPEQLSYVVRTSVPPLTLAPAVRAVVSELDPAIPVADVRTLEQVIADATAATAFALTLIGLAAAIALLLGAVGVYAVVAYAVSCRRAEIGIRMALGARAVDVRALVLRQGGRVVLAGIAAGLAAALALTRLMTGLLHGISPTDPVSYVALTAILAAVAALALALPAVRASRVDPLEALRRE